jgi:putative transcriptional regulator
MKTQLSKKFYAELADTAKKIVKYQKGEKVTGYTTVVRSAPVSEKEVKAVRKMVHQTQAGFAGMIGVSTKLVQAWEQGWRKPEPSLSKVIRAIKEQPKILELLARQ